MTLAKRIEDFYSQLEIEEKLPQGIEVMNPHSHPQVKNYVKSFLENFFSDNRPRVLVFGINPGRFGAGITGVTFTDPVYLQSHCRVRNHLDKKHELSAEFVYKFIDYFGGPDKFYSQFFLTAVSPLGYLKNGINYNYYDDKKLLAAVEPFIVKTIEHQIEIGGRRDVAILLGSGKNRVYFEKLNTKYKFFDKVLALDHPRFIMQYRRKQINEYLKKYYQVYSEAWEGEVDKILI